MADQSYIVATSNVYLASGTFGLRISLSAKTKILYKLVTWISIAFVHFPLLILLLWGLQVAGRSMGFQARDIEGFEIRTLVDIYVVKH